MKRFVVFALVAAIAGGAYAQGPITSVYDFKAIVKNTNIKTINVKASDMPITSFIAAPKASAKVKGLLVEVKYVQNTVLYGYLIDGGHDMSWAVIANQGPKVKVGRLFYAEPQDVRLFDPKFKRGNSKEDPYIVTFGAEGGLVMNQAEQYEGDNVLDTIIDGAYEVNAWDGWNDSGLFGRYDDDGYCWLAAAGFGAFSVKVPQFAIKSGKYYDNQFKLSLSGSIIGGWYYCDECTGGFDLWFPVDMHLCGEYSDFAEDLFSDYEVEDQNSWIAGTWTLTTNTRLKPIYCPWDSDYGPSYTAAALKAINPNQRFDEADDYVEYP